MRASRVLYLLLPFGLLAAALAAAGCGKSGDDDGKALLSRAFANVQKQDTFSVTQTMTMTQGSQNLKATTSMIVAPPDRAYAKQSLSGIDVEIVILGEQAYIKQPGTPWQTASLQALGFKPESLYQSFDMSEYASKADIAGQVNEAGRTLTRIKVDVDSETYAAAISRLFSSGTDIAGTLEGARFNNFAIEYLISKDDELVRRGSMSFDLEYQGQTVQATSTFTYTAFNAPFAPPADLPGTR